MNRVRVRYIRNHSMLHFKSTSESKPLHNLKIADIGCGGGILTEVCSFIAHFFIYLTGGSRLYVVSGDRWWPLIREVRISRQHRNTLLSIQKRAGSSIVVELPVAFEVSCSFPSLSHFSRSDDLISRKVECDIVCSMEVVEHVPDPGVFVGSLLQLVKVLYRLFHN